MKSEQSNQAKALAQTLTERTLVTPSGKTSTPCATGRTLQGSWRRWNASETEHGIEEEE